MAHGAKAVANALILRAIKAGHPITPLAAMKLVYFCHGWMWAIHDRPLIIERVEAWRHGPVIPELYHYLKRYRWRPITEALAGSDNPEPFDKDELGIIDQVLGVYGKFSGTYLSALTHVVGSPWLEAIRHGRNSEIDSRDIKRFFLEQGRKNRAIRSAKS